MRCNSVGENHQGSYKFYITHPRKSSMKRCRFEQPLTLASVKVVHALNRRDGDHKINRPTFRDMSTING
jgi:hypothetical protein